jgi:hypothetical protein
VAFAKSRSYRGKGVNSLRNSHDVVGKVCGFIGIVIRSMNTRIAISLAGLDMLFGRGGDESSVSVCGGRLAGAVLGCVE